jgi:hypothetical protein
MKILMIGYSVNGAIESSTKRLAKGISLIVKRNLRKINLRPLRIRVVINNNPIL